MARVAARTWSNPSRGRARLIFFWTNPPSLTMVITVVYVVDVTQLGDTTHFFFWLAGGKTFLLMILGTRYRYCMYVRLNFELLRSAVHSLYSINKWYETIETALVRFNASRLADTPALHYADTMEYSYGIWWLVIGDLLTSNHEMFLLLYSWNVILWQI